MPGGKNLNKFVAHFNSAKSNHKFTYRFILGMKIKVKVFVVAALSTELLFYKKQSFLHHQRSGIQFPPHDQLYKTQE